MKTYQLRGVQYGDNWNPQEQEVWSDEPKFGFRVRDLCECPEDATVTRDLFNAHDLLGAIRFGIELNKKGFDDVGIVWEEREEDQY